MIQEARFGMGCFWHPDDFFSKLKGVTHTEVGYSGGSTKNPTYITIADHTETVRIEFNPATVSYRELLGHFWREHDPFSLHKTQYKSAIFYLNDAQHKEATESKHFFEKESGKTAATEIHKAGLFYPAEEYHQKYFSKHGLRGKVC